MHAGRIDEYIAEKRWERKLKRSLKQEVFARPISWGNFVEKIAFEKLPLSYRLLSKTTVIHTEFDCWAGSTDLLTPDAVGNIKCPELKSFCQMVDTGGDPEALRAYKYGEYFWQLISDACINNRKYAELIPYVPYFNDLTAIQDRASIAEDQFQWIFYADVATLPYLHKDCAYKDLNIIRFDADPYKDQLIERVKQAEKLLNEK